MSKLGGTYSKGADWGSYVKKDSLLITGQNPGSSEEAAKVLLEALAAKQKGFINRNKKRPSQKN